MKHSNLQSNRRARGEGRLSGKLSLVGERRILARNLAPEFIVHAQLRRDETPESLQGKGRIPLIPSRRCSIG
jgi:hypothetical protein